MANQENLTRRLADLSRVLVGAQSLDTTLERVAALSTSIIEACDSCGISLLAENGSVSTRHASDERADRVDELQYSTGEGPCLHAIEHGDVVQVASFDAETRWPAFIERALEEGIVASYSVPLRIEDDIVGSLNMYSRHGSFGESDEQLGDLLASQAAVALKNAQTFHDVLDMVEQLNEALGSRDVIGQAKGMLMARYSIDADAAFDLMRRESQHRNVKLRQLASDIAERRTDIEFTTSTADGGDSGNGS